MHVACMKRYNKPRGSLQCGFCMRDPGRDSCTQSNPLSVRFKDALRTERAVCLRFNRTVSNNQTIQLLSRCRRTRVSISPRYRPVLCLRTLTGLLSRNPYRQRFWRYVRCQQFELFAPVARNPILPISPVAQIHLNRTGLIPNVLSSFDSVRGSRVPLRFPASAFSFQAVAGMARRAPPERPPPIKRRALRRIIRQIFRIQKFRYPKAASGPMGAQRGLTGITADPSRASHLERNREPRPRTIRSAYCREAGTRINLLRSRSRSIRPRMPLRNWRKCGCEQPWRRTPSPVMRFSVRSFRVIPFCAFRAGTAQRAITQCLPLRRPRA